jgi:hypothetical protein
VTEQAFTNITGAIVTVLPSVISLVQALFKKQHPDLPVPTSAEVMAAFLSTCSSTLAKDEEWLAAHPKE